MPAMKSPITSTALRSQQRETKARLEALRQAQVEALEEGRTFEHNNEILVEMEKLAAFEKAIARAEEREELQRNKLARQASRSEAAATIELIKETEAARLTALSGVETAMNSLIDAIAQFEAQSERARLAYSRGLSFCSRQPAELRRLPHLQYSPHDLEVQPLTRTRLRDRLGGYMSSTFGALTVGDFGHGQFGPITWQHSIKLEKPWVEVERAVMDGMIRNDITPNLAYVIKNIPEDAAHA